MAQILLLRTFKGINLFLEESTKKPVQQPFSPPLYLLYLASSLEQNNHTCSFLDVTFEPNPTECITEHLPGSDMIIIHVLPGSQNASKALASYIRSKDAVIPIIIHGLYCTINPIQALNDIPDANICIKGEGEHIIANLIDAVQCKKDLSSIPGIYYRNQQQIKKGYPSVFIKDLDTLPFPSRDLCRNYEYGKMNNTHLCKPPFTSLITSRGCTFHCRFCTTRYINGPYRQRSAENVLEELTIIRKHYQSLMIEDDNFLADNKRAHQIFDGLIDQDNNLELFIAGARVDNPDRALYEKMAQAGVKFISYGIESGNQNVLDYYHKNITLAQIRKTIDLAIEMNIIAWGNFIFGAPIETKKQLQDTLQFSLSLPLDMAFYRHLSYQRGSKLWKKAVSDQIISEKTDFCYVGSGKTATHFTEKELAEFCQHAFKKFYYRPTYVLREVIRCLKRRDFTILRSLYAAI